MPQTQTDPNARRLAPETLLKYAVLQLPGLGLIVIILVVLRRWVELPLSWLLGSVALWLLKDILLYPLVWRAYDPQSSSPHSSMLGRQGLSKARLEPAGYVEVSGELWRAEIAQGSAPIAEGDRVRVVDAQGLTLIVELDPAASDDADHPANIN